MSPDSRSFLMSFGASVCAVSLIPGNKWRVTHRLIFLPRGLFMLQQELQEWFSWKPVRTSLLNINAEVLKINSDKGDFYCFLKCQYTKSIKLALKEPERNRWLSTSNWASADEKRNCLRVAEKLEYLDFFFLQLC